MAKDFRRALVIGVSFIAGSFILFGLFLYFLSGAVDAKVKEVSKDRGVVVGRAGLIEGLAQQKASSPEVKKYQQAIDLLLPKKDELVNFSEWVDGLARARNVGAEFSFSGEAVSPSGAATGYIKFSLNASGRYSELVDFLRDVESKAPRYTVSFEGFDLKRSGDNYTISVNGRIFFR